jgi:hypothetical protein
MISRFFRFFQGVIYRGSRYLQSLPGIQTLYMWIHSIIFFDHINSGPCSARTFGYRGCCEIGKDRNAYLRLVVLALSYLTFLIFYGIQRVSDHALYCFSFLDQTGHENEGWMIVSIAMGFFRLLGTTDSNRRFVKPQIDIRCAYWWRVNELPVHFHVLLGQPRLCHLLMTNT